ncbi:MAG: hypothetical protein U5R31_05330 [Acidimicrobiia bacterium]|nr:hypothetical protein [Acidimicrobiia bacterium]
MGRRRPRPPGRPRRGRTCPSYGSYLLAGEPHQEIDTALETTAALGATTLRVWPGLVDPDTFRADAATLRALLA